MRSRALAYAKSNMHRALLPGSVNLRGLGASNQSYGRGSSTPFSTSVTAARRSPVAALLLPPRQQQLQQYQPHRGGCLVSRRSSTTSGSVRCSSSTPTVMAVSPAPEPVAASPLRSGSLWPAPLSSAARAAHHRHDRSHHHRRGKHCFCTSSGSGSSSSSSSSSSGASGKLGDIHVTHVEAAAGGRDDGDAREMMPEEDRQPVGAGSATQGSGDEPNTVRFLDVPGSEQTREEKMTIVFTCTVCETRTAKTFAKLSYEKGVVLARCPGCHNLHLIADRLGWFEEAGDGADGWDIEKITNRIGESDCHVVNEDNVMELNLVDLVGKTTKQKEVPPPAGNGRE
ncbi:unnamed protein product [Pylaiella littoralis]